MTLTHTVGINPKAVLPKFNKIPRMHKMISLLFLSGFDFLVQLFPVLFWSYVSCFAFHFLPLLFSSLFSCSPVFHLLIRPWLHNIFLYLFVNIIIIFFSSFICLYISQLMQWDDFSLSGEKQSSLQLSPTFSIRHWTLTLKKRLVCLVSKLDENVSRPLVCSWCLDFDRKLELIDGSLIECGEQPAQIPLLLFRLHIFASDSVPWLTDTAAIVI